MKIWIRKWEESLKDGNNPRILEKWKNESKKFGKKRLLKLFWEAANEFNKKDNKGSEKFTMGIYVINGLKKEKWRDDNNITYENRTFLEFFFHKFITLTKTISSEIYKELSQWPDKELSSMNHRHNEYIQLSLFDELDGNKSQEIKKTVSSQQTHVVKNDMIPEWTTPWVLVWNDNKNYWAIKKDEKDEKIDLDALYAPDPDEPWWNR